MSNGTDCSMKPDTEPDSSFPKSRVDFDRQLVCVLGLPFDAIGVAEAVERVRADAFAGRRCFLSTPNLNFAVAALSDQAFRNSVLRSDLSLIDGMPLVWIAHLLGLPIPQRASGSDVFEALQAHDGPAIKVYLFGGPPGAVAQACEQINLRGGGVVGVGFESPGFGSVESMSGDDQLARINDSGAHFVVVALGARKGQAWIERNAPRLKAPVLAHLGAVVNFAAGVVRRAPWWMQRWGLEWIWRIKEEPSLWRRYSKDGLSAAALFLTRVLPDAIESRGRFAPGPPPSIEIEPTRQGSTTLSLRGVWRNDLSQLREALKQCAYDDASLTIDLSGAVAVSSSLVALMLIAEGWFGGRFGFRVVGANRRIVSTFHRKLADSLLSQSSL